MPLFSYRCSDCNNKFEVLFFIGDKQPSCPKCGSCNTERDFASLKGFNCTNSTCSGSCATCKGCHH